MLVTTISVQNSGSFDKVQLKHDNRERDENGQPYFSKNVDSSLSQNNWYWEGNMSIKEFYEREFEDAFRLQTEKIRASHPDRLEGRASSYFEQVLSEQMEGEKLREQLKLEGLCEKDINKKMSAVTKLAYQTIIQFGDRDSEFGTLNGTEEGREIAKKVMREFIEKWQREHPEMKLINVALHADEVGADGKGGTIHMHITYCPVCTSYKKGMPVRNSLTGALKQMGYEADKKKDPETGEFRFAVEKWQQDMRDDLEVMLGEHGFTRFTPEDTRRDHESIADYGKRKDQLRKIAEGQEQVERGQQENAEQKADLDHREEIVQKKEQRIDARVEQVNTFLQQHKERVDEANQALTEREAAVEEREQILQAEAEATVKKIEVAVSEAIASVKPAPGKRLEDYSQSKMKRGHRLVPDKDLETYIDRSWYRPDHIKQTMQKVIDKFNELPFVQAARNTIFELEQQVLQLKKLIKKKDEEIEKQKVLLDKAKTLKIDTFGKSMYDRLVEEVAKDREKVKEKYDHEDDRSGR
ncbi:MAG: hypothetical protein IJ298_04280 [Ruminococcus sp.]|nr:hypothetical protein [Ruminococcus sp.]